MSSLIIPMSKATGLGQLPEILEQFAGSKAVSKAYNLAGLPMEIIEFPNTKIPLEAMRDLFEISAQASGDRCFGLKVGRNMTHSAFGLWMQYCTQGDTLAVGLDRVIRCAGFQQTGSEMLFDATAPVSFWRYIAPSGSRSRPIHHGDHLIWPMIGFVRTYLGPDWLPEWVELNYPRDALAHKLEAQLPFPVRFGTPNLALATQYGDLSRCQIAPTGLDKVITFGDVSASEAPGLIKEPLDTVFNTVALRLLEGQTDIDGAARLIGVGVQKLQRDLRREGLDYRSILNRAKNNRAKALLADTSLPVIDIAFSLGYSDHANFSRAFKRMVGLSPVHFRAEKTAPI